MTYTDPTTTDDRITPDEAAEISQAFNLATTVYAGLEMEITDYSGGDKLFTFTDDTGEGPQPFHAIYDDLAQVWKFIAEIEALEDDVQALDDLKTDLKTEYTDILAAGRGDWLTGHIASDRRAARVSEITKELDGLGNYALIEYTDIYRSTERLIKVAGPKSEWWQFVGTSSSTGGSDWIAEQIVDNARGKHRVIFAGEREQSVFVADVKNSIEASIGVNRVVAMTAAEAIMNEFQVLTK